LALGVGTGVFHHLIDSAEEEECKEAVLGYYFLLMSDTPLSSQQLDERIEQWFSARFHFDIDFEIEDALAKLTRFGIVTVNDGRYQAKPLSAAKAKLDETWDAYFVG